MFFEKSGLVWDTLHALEGDLAATGIDYVVIGGLDLNAHNYPRQTVDVDIVMRASDFEKFRARFAATRYLAGTGSPQRFVNAQTEVVADVLVTGELASNTKKNRSVCFPDPSEAEVYADLRTAYRECFDQANDPDYEGE